MSPRASFETAFDKTAEARAALAANELLPINLEIPSAISTVLAALPRARTLHAQIVPLFSAAEVAEIDAIETYADALLFAHTAYLAASQPVPPLHDLFERATEQCDMLMSDATALANRGIIDGKVLAGLKGGTGYLAVADDLGAIVRLMRARWSDIGSRTAVQPSELVEAEQIYEKVTRAIPIVCLALLTPAQLVRREPTSTPPHRARPPFRCTIGKVARWGTRLWRRAHLAVASRGGVPKRRAGLPLLAGVGACGRRQDPEDDLPALGGGNPWSRCCRGDRHAGRGGPYNQRGRRCALVIRHHRLWAGDRKGICRFGLYREGHGGAGRRQASTIDVDLCCDIDGTALASSETAWLRGELYLDWGCAGEVLQKFALSISQKVGVELNRSAGVRGDELRDEAAARRVGERMLESRARLVVVCGV